MKYPIGTILKSKSSPELTGTIIKYEGTVNTIEWSDGVKANWNNQWYDSNIDFDSDKTVILPIFIPEELFEI